MELSGEQLQKIVDAVAERFGLVRLGDAAWPQNPPVVQLPPEFYESFRQISDRLSRVEERIDQFDRRFEELIHQMDKRFEQVDKRFEQIDKRFEQVDKRFEQVDKRFDDLIHYVDKRFV